MKNRLYYVLSFCFLFLGAAGFCQQTITGKVTDPGGIPLPGVNILIENTSQGTQSDFDGNYTINAEIGNTLVFSFLGYQSKKVPVGQSTTINVTMEEDVQSLEEVVVTAQGITREKKALGYSVTTLKSDEVESRPQSDIGRSLAGKVAGLNIIGTSGIAGSGTSINIRDKSSVTQSNQPLFVVDGVPFDSNTNQLNTFGSDAASSAASSRFLDLDPNNIADISILKGLSATVLYGQAGSNGVILITTKSGSKTPINKKFEVAVSQTTFFTEISNLPDYQNTYGQGADLNFNNNYVGNWGPRFDPNVLIPNYYDKAHITPVFPEFAGSLIPYVPVENNVEDFFRTGVSNATSVNMAGGNETSKINLNFGHTDEEGYIPENNVQRTTFSLGGSSKLANNLSFSGTLNYTLNDFQTPPAGANNGNLSLFTRLMFIPRTYDINNLPYQNPVDGSSIYYRTDIENPRWILDNARFSQNTRRFFSSFNLNYEFNDHVGLTYRLGLDTYNERQRYYVNKGGVTSTTDQLGFLRQTSAVNTIWDHTFLLTAKGYEVGGFGLNALAGLNLRRDTYDQVGVANVSQIVFGFLDSSNYRTQTNSDPFGAILETESYQNVIGLYGQLEFDYNNYLYLTLSGRNDWGSTVEEDNRSLFYPSVSMSFIPTSAFENLDSDVLNYLKLRASYGTSAKFPGPYTTRPNLIIGTQQFTDSNGNNIDTNSSASLFANPNLKPELLKEIEVGLETRLFNNRIGLDVSVYKRNAEDQILQKPLDNSTGFSSTFINAGEIETKGIEIGLNFSPIKNDEFQWNVNTNFTAYETTVLSLPNDDDQIAYAGFTAPGNYAIVGQPLGVIQGNYALRDANGDFLIDNTTGLTISSASLGLPSEIIGDPNPDWRLNGTTSISYKGFTLAGQLEYTHGGDIFSQTIGNYIRRGVTTYNEDGRERLLILPGTSANPNTGEPILDQNGNPRPNDYAITYNDTYFLNITDTDAERVYDASLIRLREVSLTYELPSKFLDRTPFGSISLSAIGQNLWYDAINIPDAFNFDPETSGTGVGNSAGLDFSLAPSAKRYGLSVKATF